MNGSGIVTQYSETINTLSVTILPTTVSLLHSIVMTLITIHTFGLALLGQSRI